MSSVVYYQFRSSKQPQRLKFDGTGISVFDVKRGILLVQRLDTTADTFQLVLSNPDTQEECIDDSVVLPRSTLVEARRLPLIRAGSHGAASQYVSGSLAINAKNASRRDNFRNVGTSSRPDGANMFSSAAGGGFEEYDGYDVCRTARSMVVNPAGDGHKIQGISAKTTSID